MEPKGPDSRFFVVLGCNPTFLVCIMEEITPIHHKGTELISKSKYIKLLIKTKCKPNKLSSGSLRTKGNEEESYQGRYPILEKVVSKEQRPLLFPTLAPFFHPCLAVPPDVQVKVSILGSSGKMH